jgi:hypothetical protein
MDTHIVAVYCLCADLLAGLRHRDDPQCQLTDAEIMTIAVVAALFFGGNYALTCLRRVHRIKDLFLTLFAVLADYWKAMNHEATYIIDSFPIASCDNIRIKRSRRYQGEDYRGYIASKRRYFYGVRLHLVITAQGHPIEFFVLPGSDNDTGALQWYGFNLPPGSTILGDKAFNVDAIEDALHAADVALCPLRKKNSKRAIAPGKPTCGVSHGSTLKPSAAASRGASPKLFMR